ncbi:reverse transcriptase domain-containing protein [Tanacetum coccineum]|uniref:Reverse transcriptase domain-containing protein n=1 Tax=Tanacetum coccineum TaxID=301880 RepID=A0ABQ4Y6Q5_9ASTR
MREVHYHSWLSNPVMVKKHDGSWRMCVDFTDLNKSCPKDCYPLPEIDWKNESFCGYPFKCFLDAYKGYHQIQMAEKDEEKTAFHTNQEVFCYTKMPFGLKNAKATYQRLVDKAFEKQIGCNMEVYVDDLVIKSHTEQEIPRDIEETFRTLRRINMKLNPKKCTFGAEEGMFLGHIVNVKGIRACPDKAEAVIRLPSPRTLKEVQSLNGKLASLNRLLSTSAEKSLPFFKTLKNCMKNSDFQWTPEAEEPKRQSARPRSKLSSMEKLVLALVHASRRLRRGCPPAGVEAEETVQDPWILSTDGSSCLERSGAGLILTNPEGTKFTYALIFEFEASNNEAEYEALLAAHSRTNGSAKPRSKGGFKAGSKPD